MMNKEITSLAVDVHSLKIIGYSDSQSTLMAMYKGKLKDVIFLKPDEELAFEYAKTRKIIGHKVKTSDWEHATLDLG